MIDDVTAWLQSCGLKVDRAELDGKIHRVPGSKAGKKDGWYVGYSSPVVVCDAGDWSAGSGALWKYRAKKTLSADERKVVRDLQSKLARSTEDALTAEQNRVAEETAERLKILPRAHSDHPYLARKAIGPHGAFLFHDTLYLPAYDVKGKIWGAQMISPDGAKKFHKSQRVKGTFFPIGTPDKVAYICEGFATGMTIHSATGTAVFCAWAANYLLPAAVALRAAYPDLKFIIAGDNDRATDGNPGVTAAEAAAREIGACVVIPQFDRNDPGTDFNDLMTSEGLEAVQRQLQGAERPMATVTHIHQPDRKAGGVDETFEAIVAKMTGAGPLDWPAFTRRFHIVRDVAGRKSFLEETSPGLVSFIVDEAIQDEIIKYARDVAAGKSIALTPYQARTCFQLWSALVPALPEPPQTLVEKDAPGLAFNRLPFNYASVADLGEPVAFKEFLGRCSQPDAVAAFIGSLFFPDADRSQYLYMYGQGNDGKGTLLAFLQALMGSAAVSLEPPEGPAEKRFFNMNTYGKRLVYFPDCDSPDFFASAKFKSHTGNDAIFFEPKGEKGFSALPTSKFIAASNHKPRISSQTSDQRRMIFVEFQSIATETIVAKYERRLLEEAQRIVAYCREKYLALAMRNGVIKCSRPVQIAAEAEETYAALFHRHFEQGDSFVAGERVLWVFKSEGIRNTKEMGKIKAAWMRMFDIDVRQSEDPRRKNCLDYFGMTYAPKNYGPIAMEPYEDPTSR